MQIYSSRNPLLSIRIICISLWMASLPACSLQMISEYDQESVNRMHVLAKDIDYFFASMLYQEEKSRTFQRYKKNYLNIEVDINALKMQQEYRALNDLTSKQVSILASLWTLEKEQHQKNNSMSDFIIKRHRKQYNNVLLAIIKGENAKSNQ